MKATSRVDRRALWQYLANLFIEYENFKMNVLEKIKSHLCRGAISRKYRRLLDKCEKCVTDWQVIDGVTKCGEK